MASPLLVHAKSKRENTTGVKTSCGPLAILHCPTYYTHTYIAAAASWLLLAESLLLPLRCCWLLRCCSADCGWAALLLYYIYVYVMKQAKETQIGKENANVLKSGAENY